MPWRNVFTLSVWSFVLYFLLGFLTAGLGSVYLLLFESSQSLCLILFYLTNKMQMVDKSRGQRRRTWILSSRTHILPGCTKRRRLDRAFGIPTPRPLSVRITTEPLIRGRGWYRKQNRRICQVDNQIHTEDDLETTVWVSSGTNSGVLCLAAWPVTLSLVTTYVCLR